MAGFVGRSFDCCPSVDVAVRPEALEGCVLDEFPVKVNYVHPERWFDKQTMNGCHCYGTMALWSQVWSQKTERP